MSNVECNVECNYSIRYEINTKSKIKYQFVNSFAMYYFSDTIHSYISNLKTENNTKV